MFDPVLWMAVATLSTGLGATFLLCAEATRNPRAAYILGIIFSIVAVLGFLMFVYTLWRKESR